MSSSLLRSGYMNSCPSSWRIRMLARVAHSLSGKPERYSRRAVTTTTVPVFLACFTRSPAWTSAPSMYFGSLMSESSGARPGCSQCQRGASSSTRRGREGRSVHAAIRPRIFASNPLAVLHRHVMDNLETNHDEFVVQEKFVFTWLVVSKNYSDVATVLCPIDALDPTFEKHIL